MQNTQKEKTHVKRFYEPVCPKVLPKYEWRVDDEGHHYQEKVGEYDADAEIQLYKDSCDIKVIIDRMMKGDAATITMLAQPLAYGDVNDFPQDVHPRAFAQGLHQLYENQSDAVKEKFPTFEKFANYFTSLTDAMIAELIKPKDSEDVDNGQ